MLAGPPRGLAHCCACDRGFLEYARQARLPNQDYLVRDSHRRKIRCCPNLVSGLEKMPTSLVTSSRHGSGEREDTEKKKKEKKRKGKREKRHELQGVVSAYLIDVSSERNPESSSSEGALLALREP